ncbi:iron-sulfur cluster biosynthesis family protein [Domibacillus sp.]|uniref:iron-sulfur cluster biosynthesis family protein n=1 Tax=Domibacillus sp. TaxID=1969783 RepID=UPI0028118C69|nr:iron-sulfur cluster biosynthesis family protein [Domibacillus sp.]
MSIVLTDAARRQLLASSPAEGHVPRIDAEMSGGCGVSVRFSLVWEEPRRGDTVVPLGDDLFLHLDRFTERYLEEHTLVDYSETDGFIFGDGFNSSCTT